MDRQVHRLEFVRVRRALQPVRLTLGVVLPVGQRYPGTQTGEASTNDNRLTRFNHGY